LSTYQPSWRALFEQEVAARDRLNRLRIDGSRPDGKILRSWWKSVQELLRAYAIAVARGTPPNHPQPNSHKFCQALPDIWRSASYQGQSTMPEKKGDDLLVQMSYVTLAGPSPTAKPAAQNASIITAKPFAFQTRQPVKTLATSFKVDANTVRGWVRDYPPAFCGVNNINADVIIKHTEQAGRRYANCGRGAESVRRRSRKG